MTASTSRRRGFATMLAVCSIFLVSVTITCLMLRFSTEARRTREETDRAQLRQLIIAGSRSNAAVPLTLPDELSKSGGKVEVHFDKDETMAITAEFNQRHQRWSGKLK